MIRFFGKSVCTVLAVSLLILPFSTVRSYSLSCFPTCSSVDGRFLAITEGAAFQTLTPSSLNIRLVVPGVVDSFSLGIFDGDHLMDTNGNGEFHWDTGNSGSQVYTYVLKADPDRDNNGSVVFNVESTSLVNNEWIDYNIMNDPAAMDADGNFVYTLTISLIGNMNSLNAFKIRSDVGVLEIDEIFTFLAQGTNEFDLPILYPNVDLGDGVGPEDLEGTTYDGTFSFFFEVSEPADEIVFWDGDSDRGSFDDMSTWDTDDLNTPNVIPPFADGNSDTLAEGINPPDPFDDLDPDGGFLGINFFYVRAPAITYEMISPTGNIYHNPNPSGNREWENFVISRLSVDPNVVDFGVDDPLPVGTYEIRFNGVDITNIISINPLFPIVLRGEVIPPGPGEPGFVNPTNVPTMSEWGLLAVAVIMGLIGIAVVRRKQQLS